MKRGDAKHNDIAVQHMDEPTQVLPRRTLPSGLAVHDLLHGGGRGFEVPPLLKEADLNDKACQDMLRDRHQVWPWSLQSRWRQLEVLIIAPDLQSVKTRAQKLGSPAGELVFFGDLVFSLLCSGHRVVLVENLTQLKGTDLSTFDVFYTERNWIGTIEVLEELGVIKNYPCKARLLDFFGMSCYKLPEPMGLRQIVTPYPYRTGNDFYGMILRNRPDEGANVVDREPCGILWGKEPKYFEHAHVQQVLQALNFTRLVSTINQHLLARHSVNLPPHVENLGTIDRAEFVALMRKCTFLLGVGDPVMGPTAMEAVVNGAVFLNPIRPDPPISLNYDEPHTTQHHYLAGLGEPYVRIIDLAKPAEVVQTVKQVLAHPLKGGHPFPEFTLRSMAERVIANILNPEVCPLWLRPALPSEGLVL